MPSADSAPAYSGTRTVRMPSSRAIPQACKPPQPPNATRAKSRGSWPRSTAQQAALVNSRDGTTPGADRVYIEHRHAHGKTIDGRLHRFSRVAIHQTDIGGRTAHVETQNARESGKARGLHRSNDAPGRS